VCARFSDRWLRRTLRIVSRAHLVAHRVTGGRVGAHWRGADVVMITTIGRTSGRRHTTPLLFLPYGAGIAVVASSAGTEHPPHWWHNLQREPRAHLEIAGTRKRVVARAADTHEQAFVSARFREVFPRFDRYRHRAHRDIPVVLLEPLS